MGSAVDEKWWKRELPLQASPYHASEASLNFHRLSFIIVIVNSYSYILNTSPCQYMFCKYYFLFCVSSQFFDNVIWSTNIFNFHEILFIFFFFCHLQKLLFLLYLRRLCLRSSIPKFMKIYSKCEGLFLNPQFCPINRYVCPHVSTTVSTIVALW